jgi:hypothetical protein
MDEEDPQQALIKDFMLLGAGTSAAAMAARGFNPKVLGELRQHVLDQVKKNFSGKNAQVINDELAKMKSSGLLGDVINSETPEGARMLGKSTNRATYARLPDQKILVQMAENMFGKPINQLDAQETLHLLRVARKSVTGHEAGMAVNTYEEVSPYTIRHEDTHLGQDLVKGGMLRDERVMNVPYPIQPHEVGARVGEKKMRARERAERRPDIGYRPPFGKNNIREQWVAELDRVQEANREVYGAPAGLPDEMLKAKQRLMGYVPSTAEGPLQPVLPPPGAASASAAPSVESLLSELRGALQRGDAAELSRVKVRLEEAAAALPRGLQRDDLTRAAEKAKSGEMFAANRGKGGGEAVFGVAAPSAGMGIQEMARDPETGEVPEWAKVAGVVGNVAGVGALGAAWSKRYGGFGGRSLYKTELGLGKADKMTKNLATERVSAMLRGKADEFDQQLMSQGLPPEQAQLVKEGSANLFEAHTKSLVDNRPYAKMLDDFHAGRGGSEWYEKVGGYLAEKLGPEDGQMFARFLAATSINATVKANTTLALRAFSEWKAGLEFVKKPPTGKALAKLQRENPAELKRLVDAYNNRPKGQESYLSSVVDELNRAKAGEAFEGRKIENFARAILGDPNAIVIDRWMMRWAGFPATEAFGAADDPIYDIVEDMVRKAAAEHGVTPRQMQAAIWKGTRDRLGIVEEKTGKTLRTEYGGSYDDLLEDPTYKKRVLWQKILSNR